MRMTEERKAQGLRAEAAAKKILKKGDKLTITNCPGTKRWIIFNRWDGCWIVAKSGRDDYHPVNISKINGKPISFK